MVIQAARSQAVSLESAATTEMTGAEEAFMQLGDAEVTVRLRFPPPFPLLLLVCCGMSGTRHAACQQFD